MKTKCYDAKKSVWAKMLLVFICLGLSLGAAIGQDDEEKALLELDHKNFDNPTIIDNEWWPMKPGMQYIYEGYTVEDDEKIDHRIVFTVTDLTKVIDGIRAVVIWDRDFSDGMLEESELTFFAQDNDGNIWHLGQHSEIYDEVELLGYRTWLVGHQEGTKAGIMMKAKPDPPGSPSYSQGYAPPPFNWTDRARTHKIGAKTKVAYGSFDDVLVMAESSDEEPDAFQLKYYARGVGVVRVGFWGGDPNQETLELVDVIELSPEALAEARAEALKIEERAYVYASTPPAEQSAMTSK